MYGHLCPNYNMGKLKMEFSSHVGEIPDDADATLSQKLISCSTPSQEYCRQRGQCRESNYEHSHALLLTDKMRKEMSRTK